MLASLADAPLNDPHFVYEPKYDGIRAIAEIGPKGSVRLWSRLGNEKTRQFPEIARENYGGGETRFLETAGLHFNSKQRRAALAGLFRHPFSIRFWRLVLSPSLMTRRAAAKQNVHYNRGLCSRHYLDHRRHARPVLVFESLLGEVICYKQGKKKGQPIIDR